MDRIQAKSGFLPGLTSLFPRKKASPSNPSTHPNQSQSASQEKSKASADQSLTDNMQGPKASPIFRRIPNKIRNHFIASAAEFVGTFLFLFLAFAATQVANSAASTSGSQSTNLPQGPQPQILMYISLAFGLSLLVNAWVFFRISGGLFNPAVSYTPILAGARVRVLTVIRSFSVYVASVPSLSHAAVSSFSPKCWVPWRLPGSSKGYFLGR